MTPPTLEPGTELFVDGVPVEAAGVPRGRAMLARAQWAARAFARYDAATVQRIVAAAAAAGAAHAEQLARDTVAETGFGVVEDKVRKNLACSTGLVQAYSGHDYVSLRVDADRGLVHVPRPAGVVLALTPSTNPVCTVFFTVLLALMTRNTAVLCPHPLAKRVCSRAAALMAEAAVAAGAPDGCVQWVDEPTIPLLDALMTDPRTDLVLATGGTAVVRAAYRSGTPALGVGPGNAPVLVDATADLARAARCIVESKSFDNSVLCTNESVLVAEQAIGAELTRHLVRAGAHLLTADECDRLRAAMFPAGRFDPSYVGRDAATIAARFGVRVPARTRVLLAPFDLAVPEEVLAQEKLCPVLGVVTAATAARGIDVARAVLRISGAGHSAAIHSTDPRTILDFGAAVQVLRVSVNAGASLGGAGLETNLALSMTIGTGFFGGSSLGSNLEPRHLVDHTTLAWSTEAGQQLPRMDGLDAWSAPGPATPAYPLASNDPGALNLLPDNGSVRPSAPIDAEAAGLREEIRRLIVEELRQIVRG